MSEKKYNKFIPIVIVAFLSAVIEGCIFVGHTHVIDEPFTEQQLEKNHDRIRRGNITKTDILRWFGPPNAVFLPGEKEDIFERFKEHTTRPQLPLIYYYQNTVLIRGEFGFDGIVIPTSTTRTEKKLWILIDETSGKVVDYTIESEPDNAKIQDYSAYKPRGMP
jgi:hypothetical protein